MRIALLLVACLCMFGCAGGEAVDDGTADPQTTSGAIDGGMETDDPPLPDQPAPVNPPMDPPDDPPMDPPDDPRMDPPDDPPMDPPACEPFTRLGVCSICGPDGTPQAPETDAQCPPVECGPELTHEQVSENNEVVCYEIRQANSGAGTCLDVGTCATAADVCGEPVRTEVARVADGPCAELLGCAGPAPPEVLERIGQPCNTHGLCNVDGVCSSPAACADFDPQVAREYCGGGYEGAAPWCEFFVDPPGDASCNDVCAAEGMICMAAWSEDNNSCRKGDGLACDRRANDFVCRCRAP